MVNTELVINICYVVAAFLFIFGLKLLSNPETARKGNMISAIGMLLAVSITLLDHSIIAYQWIILGILVGVIIGVLFSSRVEMTAMPELVSLFNGFGGFASMLVGYASIHNILMGARANFHLATLLSVVFTSILIGGITFSGSIVAWAKLGRRIPARPLTFPGLRWLNLAIILSILLVAYLFVLLHAAPVWVSLAVVLSLLFGVLAVMPIGGADMPIIISILNSFSGLAVGAVGLAIGNSLLIVTGLFVGASGTILTTVMCKAINRSLWHVLTSGFGKHRKLHTKLGGTVKSILAHDAYYILEAAQSVVIIPGYGMAVAQAQHAIKELQEILEANNTEVEYAIHPVAGRMPGHMNVLLAEADVPYDQQYEMDEINPRMSNFDVAIIVGANDVVNLAAQEVEGCPIYGMPVIEAGKSGITIVLKRSTAAGFSGVDNPLFYKENTRMVFGDAKDTLNDIIREFRS